MIVLCHLTIFQHFSRLHLLRYHLGLYFRPYLFLLTTFALVSTTLFFSLQFSKFHLPYLEFILLLVTFHLMLKFHLLEVTFNCIDFLPILPLDFINFILVFQLYFLFQSGHLFCFVKCFNWFERFSLGKITVFFNYIFLWFIHHLVGVWHRM